MVLSISFTAATPASAHFLGNDSVDDREIRWEDSTRYDDARKHAINAWDNSSLNRINIAPDAWNTIADLEWRDSSRTDVTWDGLWKARTGADAIYLNVAYLKNYGTTKRRGVATHELGHALGLAHSYSGQIMVNNTPARGSLTTPQSHDKADYHALWG
ncbi:MULTISPECIES: matrixin family metalloprotease [unclassified Streptomyces]|uniref:matrixin family metalloprotease n=1 Tax=unclassified Streptomyces TaxID=2593676 RepID=UPI00131AEF28|nr:matrixin family metalloprotease [Streptomyces sp. NRRL S-31]